MFGWWARVKPEDRQRVQTPVGEYDMAKKEDDFGLLHSFEPVDRTKPFSYTTRHYDDKTKMLPYIALVGDISGSMDGSLNGATSRSILARTSTENKTRFQGMLDFMAQSVSNPFFTKQESGLSGLTTIAAFACRAKEIMSAGVRFASPNDQVMYENETVKGEDGKIRFKDTGEAVSDVILDLNHSDNASAWKRQLGNNEPFDDRLDPMNPDSVQTFCGFGDFIKKRLSSKMLVGTLGGSTHASLGFRTAMQSYAESFITPNGDMVINVIPKGKTEVVQHVLHALPVIITDGEFNDRPYTDHPFFHQNSWLIECDKDVYFLTPGIVVYMGGASTLETGYKPLFSVSVNSEDELEVAVAKMQEACQSIFTEMTQRLVLKNDGDCILKVTLWGELAKKEVTWDVYIKPKSSLVVPWMMEGGPTSFSIVEESHLMMQAAATQERELNKPIGLHGSKYRRKRGSR